MISTTIERERAKQGLQCPECWSFKTKVMFDNTFYCIVCCEQWDKHYFLKAEVKLYLEQEDEL